MAGRGGLLLHRALKKLKLGGAHEIRAFERAIHDGRGPLGQPGEKRNEIKNVGIVLTSGTRRSASVHSTRTPASA